MEGWIKLHRSLLEWEWFQDTITLHVFVYLLLRATPSDSAYKGVEIPRGSLITSVRKIGEDCHIPDKRVRTAIQRLTNSKQIVIKATNKFSLITICNYDSYQENEKTVGQTKGKQNANKGRADGQTKGEPSYKEYKNIDISNDISLLEREGNSVAAQPLPAKVRDIQKIEEEFRASLNQYVRVYPDAMLDKFADYWTEPARGGKKLRFEMEKTWDTGRRLSNWASREQQYKAKNAGYARGARDTQNTLDFLTGTN